MKLKYYLKEGKEKKIEKDLSKIINNFKMINDYRYDDRWLINAENFDDAKKAQNFIEKNMKKYGLKDVKMFHGMSGAPTVIFDFKEYID